MLGVGGGPWRLHGAPAGEARLCEVAALPSSTSTSSAADIDDAIMDTVDDLAFEDDARGNAAGAGASTAAAAAGRQRSRQARAGGDRPRPASYCLPNESTTSLGVQMNVVLRGGGGASEAMLLGRCGGGVPQATTAAAVAALRSMHLPGCSHDGVVSTSLTAATAAPRKDGNRLLQHLRDQIARGQGAAEGPAAAAGAGPADAARDSGAGSLGPFLPLHFGLGSGTATMALSGASLVDPVPALRPGAIAAAACAPMPRLLTIGAGGSLVPCNWGGLGSSGSPCSVDDLLLSNSSCGGEASAIASMALAICSADLPHSPGAGPTRGEAQRHGEAGSAGAATAVVQEVAAAGEGALATAACPTHEPLEPLLPGALRSPWCPAAAAAAAAAAPEDTAPASGTAPWAGGPIVSSGGVSDVQLPSLDREPLLPCGVPAVDSTLEQLYNDPSPDKCLFLSKQPLPVAACLAIASLLRSTRGVRVVSLTHCGLSDEGAAALASGLQCCGELLVLDLAGNMLRDEGVQALAACLDFMPSLVELQLANNAAIGDMGLVALMLGSRGCTALRKVGSRGTGASAQCAKDLQATLNSLRRSASRKGLAARSLTPPGAAAAAAAAAAGTGPGRPPPTAAFRPTAADADGGIASSGAAAAADASCVVPCVPAVGAVAAAGGSRAPLPASPFASSASPAVAPGETFSESFAQLCGVLQLLAAPRGSAAERAVAAAVSELLSEAEAVGEDLDLEFLSDGLAARGFGVAVTQAMGGGAGSECLRNLRHTFLSVVWQGDCQGRCDEGLFGDAVARAATSAAAPAPPFHAGIIIVDPALREQFVVASPTPRYEALVAALPRVFVGAEERLPLMVELLSDELAAAFRAKHCGVLPPWREAAALITKWQPRPQAKLISVPSFGAVSSSTAQAGGGSARSTAPNTPRVSGSGTAAMAMLPARAGSAAGGEVSSVGFEFGPSLASFGPGSRGQQQHQQQLMLQRMSSSGLTALAMGVGAAAARLEPAHRAVGFRRCASTSVLGFGDVSNGTAIAAAAAALPVTVPTAATAQPMAGAAQAQTLPMRGFSALARQ